MTDHLVDLVADWTRAVESRLVSLGPPPDELNRRATELRIRIQNGTVMAADLDDPTLIADSIHAVTASLSEACNLDPVVVLRDAQTLWEALNGSSWSGDELEEREDLLCTLAFICWRAARLLGRSKLAQRWESALRETFRSSLFFEVVDSVFSDENSTQLPNTAFLGRGEEGVFQIILYLQEGLEQSPRVASRVASTLYRRIYEARGVLADDLVEFLLGASALLVGATERAGGSYRKAALWLSRAEEHFKRDCCPKASLARVLLHRLTVLYGLSRCEMVSRLSPNLEETFIQLGMQDERVKCRIVWAASLKLSGHPDRALEVLAPLSSLRTEIGSRLYGWVLAEAGDAHGIIGDYRAGLTELREAALLLKEERQFTGLAHVNAMIGTICRSQGLVRDATALFRSSIEDYARLGMRSNEAYMRVLLAEALLVLNALEEAEEEANAAIPVLEEQGMVADATAALSIAREASRRRAEKRTT